MIDKNGLYDIYTIWHVPFWQTTWFKYLCGSLIIVLLLPILIIVCKRLYTWFRRKKYTAWEIAQMKLQALKKDSFANKEQGKRAYGAITAVLKEYLSQRYGWQVTTATDDELATYVQSSPLNEQLSQQIKTIFNGAVMIKFANQDAVESQVRDDIDRALQIINATIPQPKK